MEPKYLKSLIKNCFSAPSWMPSVASFSTRQTVGTLDAIPDPLFEEFRNAVDAYERESEDR
jgi:hypothetical protein